ncbi:unnamed protein product [Rotaria magnacalcarata]|uniref:Uncharacterized protein n=6 Tax=Rotaria magnacalcarata TaxID=392030 RepID=A0A816MVK2_9BILA|nr:unnamed protein product [Rotaria magnacalcarata]
MANQMLIWIRLRWRLITLILIPLIFLPLPIIINLPQAKCGYIVIIISVYWIFEIIPLPVTSLLPLVLFPMAGVLKAETVAPLYFTDITALFFGSLAFAHAIESVNLHRRIALFVLSLVGTSTKWTMAGLMGVTAFLSMWISNTAAVSIMLPVSLAIIGEVQQQVTDLADKSQANKEATTAANEVIELNEIGVSNGHTKTRVILNASELEEQKTKVSVEVKTRFRQPWQRHDQLTVDRLHLKRFDDLRKGFLLSIAYAATIGGLASLVGTGTNVFVKGYIDETYRGTAFRVNFLNFLLFGLPVGVIMLILCWLWLQILYNRTEFFKCHTDPEDRVSQGKLKAMLVKQYKDLGKPSWNEYCVGIVFIIMILLWVTRDFGETRGWSIIFLDEYMDDSTVAVLCGLLPLILPNSNPFQKNWKYESIVQWKVLVKSVSWDAIFLLGAGLSVASAFKTSKLSDSVAQVLKFLDGIPNAAIIVLVIVISGLFTEVTSNISTASIFLPILDSVARSSFIHPGLLVLPCTLAVSLAFMLPIATPPNAIIFGSGGLRVIDMVKAGIVMNILGFLVVFLAATTWMPKIYGLDDRATEIFYSINITTSTAAGY